ncbi:MAG: lytic transglycosylase domain-containing protein, partial [Alphaproteobacteria bacterium]|nr:lytic transglycosylase domain-containing protein [Alphaproteobacteria bacterium]
MAPLRLIRLAGALALSLAPALASGFPAANPAAICLAVADRAADAHGVPRAVMRALTRTETGRAYGGALQPWPWTVNMEGAGHWFDSRAEALAYVAREQARGARSFDVGCFQLN